MSIKREIATWIDAVEASGKEVDESGVAAEVCIFRAATMIAQQFEKAYSPYGINASGVEVLLYLSLEGDGKGATLASLAKRQNITPASLTNRIDQLESRGLVERVASKDDKRIIFAKLTKSGKETAEKVLPIKLDVEANLLKGLKKGDRKDFVKLLVKFAESFETSTD